MDIRSLISYNRGRLWAISDFLGADLVAKKTIKTASQLKKGKKLEATKTLSKGTLIKSFTIQL